MNYKFHKIISILGLFCFILFLGCKADHHDYYYIVQNSTDTIGDILLTYSLEGETETQERVKQGESFTVYERKGVSGDDVWNIETSSALYAIPAIVATNLDSTRMTEELSQRSFWPSQPDNLNHNGIYTLKITDDMFVLEKQEGYNYYVSNATSDTLFVTASFSGDIRKRDTIAREQTAKIGEAEIYTYNETLHGTDKYIEKKLSGISSLTVKYKGNSKNIILKNYKLPNLQVEVEEQQSVLTLTNRFFDW